MLSHFPLCLQYSSNSIYEVGGVGVRSATLHLSVELPEVSECCVSVESITEAFLLPVFCFTGHSLEHFCLFFHERFNGQVWVWLAPFFLPQFHHCPIVSSLCLSFLNDQLSVVDLLCELACELAALTSLTYHNGTDIGVSVLAQSLVSVD